MPKYLPAGLTQCMLHNLFKKSSPYHVTQADVATPFQRLEVEKITREQGVRGRGGVIAVMYETQWTGVSRPSWEREIDLQLFRHELFRDWTGTPNQHRQTNRLYRRILIGAAQRELSRRNGERYFGARARLFSSGITAQPLQRHGASHQMGYIWFTFWMIRNRSSLLFLRRATRLRRELYEVVGVSKYT